jgi:phosphoserine phosphatase
MKKASKKRTRSSINSLKLFYHRHLQGFDLQQLSKQSSVPEKELKRYETPKFSDAAGTGKVVFPTIDRGILNKLEKVLNIEGQLAAGKEDDLSTPLINYFRQYSDESPTRKKKVVRTRSLATRAVVFDFDGTLTFSGSTRTTWETIWEHLGYHRNDCALLANQFFTGKITHEEWCLQTQDRFRDRGLKWDDVFRLGREVKLIDGISDVLNTLEERQIPAYIVSGSIWDVVSAALGDNLQRFAGIYTNVFCYDHKGILASIVGTQYDFEGKAKFLRRLTKSLGVRSSEILFVGNSINDTHAKSSGSRTLLVNPRLTHFGQSDAWDETIPIMENLTEILKFIEQKPQPVVAADRLTLLQELQALALNDLTVVGGYRRFDNHDRTRLIEVKEKIHNSLMNPLRTRENYLSYAMPGSGKTYLIQEIARDLGEAIEYVELDLSKDSQNTFNKELEKVIQTKKPCLCLLDEICGKADERWPYDTIYKKLDLNETRNDKPKVVFLMIGSSGGSLQGLRELIRSRHKGKDLLDRCLESEQYSIVVPSMGLGDALCVYVSKILEAAKNEKKEIKLVDKLAIYHAMVNSTSPRQVKMLAEKAVERVEKGVEVLKYAHHFARGDESFQEFMQEHIEAVKLLQKRTIRVQD